MKKTALFLAAACMFCAGVFAQKNGVASKPAVVPAPAARAVTLTTSDGWTLASVFRPPQDDKHMLVFLHSHKEDSAIWKTLAARAEAQGYGTFLIDFRGHGGSTAGPGGTTLTHTSFDRDIAGPDNNYNKMTEDVNAALKFLSAEGIDENRVVLVGAGLGANIAIKSAAAHPDIFGMALFTPTLNANRGVLTVNPLRGYGRRPAFVAASVENSRLYQEVSVLRAILYHSAGAENVTFVTEKKGDSAELITPAVTSTFLLWLNYPSMPAPVAYRPPGSEDENAAETEEDAVPAEDTVSDNPDDHGTPVEEGFGDESDTSTE